MLSCFSRVQLLATLWSIAHQAPLSMGFSKQEHWYGLPFPTSEDLPDPANRPAPLTSPELVVSSLPLVPPGKLILILLNFNFNIHKIG